jgi:hypothetical protein
MFMGGGEAYSINPPRNKFLSIFLSIILCLSLFISYTPIQAHAEVSFTVGGIDYEYITNTPGDYTVRIVGPQNFSGTLTVPETVTIGNEYKVVEIGDNAFNSNYANLTAIDLTNATNLKRIGDGAFYRCTGLVGNLTIPGSVETIGDSAFYNCLRLVSLTISNGVKTIGDNAFQSCIGLAGNLTIPGSVESIGDNAFNHCDKLDSLVISNGVKTIGDSAFIYCGYIAGNLTIPGSVKTIGEGAFSQCHRLESLVIEDGVETIGKDAFYFCSGLTNNLVIPDSVTTIGYGAFTQCSKLIGNLTIPGGVETIGDAAFANCEKLDSLVIEDGVKKIGLGAFMFCTGLEGDLVIPDSVETIGVAAFASCSSLDRLVISNGVKTIGDMAFFGCIDLKNNLVIPDSVETIGDSAFNSCSGLTGDLVIPDSVKTIGAGAFDSCSGLTGNLVIPSNMETIGAGAFAGPAITSVDFSKNNEALIVGASIFNTSELKTIKLGSSIPTFVPNTFVGIPNDGVVFYPFKSGSEQYKTFIEDYLTDKGVIGWTFIGVLFATPASIPASTVGVAITPANVASEIGGGIPNYKYELKAPNTLPKGLELSEDSGIVSGTPTEVTPAGSVTVVISDSGDESQSLFQSTEIIVPYGAVTKAGPGGDGPDTTVDHSIIKHSHDKNYKGKDGLTAFGEDVVVEFKGDLNGKDGVTSFVFNEKEYKLSASGAETSISITDLTGANAGTITSGSVEAESLSVLATNDSVIVTLPSAFADRLENGTHEMQVWFADSTEGDKSTAGVATIVVSRAGDPKPPTIPPIDGGDAPKNGDAPKTSDNSTITLMLTLGGVSLLALLALIAYRRKARVV